MAGLWGMTTRQGADGIDAASLNETLDPLGVGITDHVTAAHGCLAASWHGGPQTSGRRLLQDRTIVGALSGTLTQPVFDLRLARLLMSDRAAAVASGLRGTFAIALLCRLSGRLRLISDRTSQQPLYWLRLNDGAAFSSTMATFCRLPGRPRFDPEWLFDFLFFNYPLGRLTFLAGVERMPPASILEIEPGRPKITRIGYAEHYGNHDGLLTESESHARGREVMTDVVARSVKSPDQTAIALTSGMDSRTILACVPPRDLPALESYTYGQPGCLDMRTADAMAAALGLHHTAVALDSGFRALLPHMCWWTVFLSGGLQSGLRATLPYVYQSLAARRPERRFLLHGAAGDHLFRDHLQGSGNRPHILSHGFQHALRHGGPAPIARRFRRLFGARYAAFRDRVQHALEALFADYGPPGDPATYLRVLLYEAGPKYFAGEEAIAGHWFALQRPFMDEDVVGLAWSTPFGVAHASRRSSRQQRYRERHFQARLIAGSPQVARLPLYDRPLSAYFPRWPWRYHLHSLRLAPRRLRQRLAGRRPQLEAWQQWMEGDLAPTLGSLLGPTSRLASLLDLTIMDETRASGDMYLAARLATAEILLRLVENGWRLPSSVRNLTPRAVVDAAA